MLLESPLARLDIVPPNLCCTDAVSSISVVLFACGARDARLERPASRSEWKPMSVIVILILASLTLAVGFLAASSGRSGLVNTRTPLTPSMRILSEDEDKNRSSPDTLT